MKTTLSCFALLLFATSIFAQEETEVWDGVLDVKVAKLRLKMELSEDDEGNPVGTMFSIDQGNAEMPFDSITRGSNKLSFSINNLGVKYEGELDSTNGTIKGTFVQGGQSFPLEFKRGEKAKPTTHFQTWQGKMDAGGKTFDFQFRVFRNEDEKMTAKLDSFTERVFGLHCDVSHNTDGSVVVEIPITKATYVGKFSEDMASIAGKWKQVGGEFELKLTQVDLEDTREPKAPERPQTPKGPFPYKSKLVFFKNEKASIKLAGTLTVPKESKVPPVVILISGSGPQDRDESIMDHKPFAVIADHLSRKGIAVFRYDERGVGQSSGDFSTATSEDFAEDVEAAIEYLKSRRDVDAGQILLAGHSEGGLIAPMVASRNDDVAGIILLAPPGVNGAKVVLNQSRLIAKASGQATEEELDQQEKILKSAFGLLDEKSDDNGDFYELFKEKVAEVKGEGNDEFELSPEIEIAVRQLDTPWFRYFASYEPVPALEKTKCPTLVLIGERDLQVDPRLNLPPIEAALKKSGNKDFSITELAGLNHLFQECETGAPSEYQMIEQTFSPKALEMMDQWIGERFLK